MPTAAPLRALTVALLAAAPLLLAASPATPHDVDGAADDRFPATAAEIRDVADAAETAETATLDLAAADTLAAARDRGAVDDRGRVVLAAVTRDAHATLDRLADRVDGVAEHRHVYGTVHQLRARPADAAAVADALAAHPDVVDLRTERRVAVAAVDDPAFATEQEPLFDRHGVLDLWDGAAPDTSATVAVLDTGVTTGDELPDTRVPDGVNLVDDRGDDGADDFSDEHGHGTRTATVVAAEADNGTGIAGICPSCEILPVRVMDDDGNGTWTDVVAGIGWALDHDADVVNMSIAGPGETVAGLDAAMDAAVDADVPVFAAAGNDGADAPAVPAYHDDVIGVAGLDDDGDDLHHMSNYGDWVTLATPMRVPAVDHTHTGWATYTGTSAATPFAAGAAALLTDHADTPADAAAALTATADDHPDVAAGTVAADDAAAFLAADTGTVAGTVTSHPSGTPVADAAVTVTVDDAAQTTTTDADGHWHLDTVPVGDAAVTAAADGHRDADADAAVHADATTTVDLTLDAYATLTGHVTDTHTNAPAADATVTAAVDPDDDGPVDASTTTDDDGAYTLSLPAGDTTVTVDADGYHPAGEAPTTSPGDEHRLDVDVNPEPVDVTVGVHRDHDDAPVAGADVALHGAHGDTATVTTGDGGHATATLTPDDYDVTVDVDDHDPAARSVHLAPGGNHTVAVAVAAHPATVTGTVADPDGEPIPDATVDADDHTADEAATTDDDGAYTLTVLPGAATITASADGHDAADHTADLSPGDDRDDVDFTLSPAAAPPPPPPAPPPGNGDDDGDEDEEKEEGEAPERGDPDPDALDDADRRRVAGDDRHATAAAAARRTLDRTGGDTVWVAPSAAFPDALAAGAAAAADGGAVALTRPDTLADDVAALVADRDLARVRVVGGSSAVDETVYDELAALGVDVDRVAGDDRYATAAAAARHAFDSAATVWLATGENHPDALAAAAAAGAAGEPLLLTRGDTLPETTADALTDLDAAEVLVVGGSSAVDETVADDLANLGVDVDRVAGDDRYATAAEVAAAALPTGEHALLATGHAFPDALAGGPLGAALSAPVLLADGDALPDATRRELEIRAGADLVEVVGLGGTSALPDHLLHNSPR